MKFSAQPEEKGERKDYISEFLDCLYGDKNPESAKAALILAGTYGDLNQKCHAFAFFLTGEKETSGCTLLPDADQARKIRDRILQDFLNTVRQKKTGDIPTNQLSALLVFAKQVIQGQGELEASPKQEGLPEILMLIAKQGLAEEPYKAIRFLVDIGEVKKARQCVEDRIEQKDDYRAARLLATGYKDLKAEPLEALRLAKKSLQEALNAFQENKNLETIQQFLRPAILLATGWGQMLPSPDLAKNALDALKDLGRYNIGSFGGFGC